MENFNPRSMAWVASQLIPDGSPVDGKIETCRVVGPRFDLGQEETPGVLVYATIDREGQQTRRVTQFDWNGAVNHSRLFKDIQVSSSRPFPLE